jgi:CubicO group peptidase (beta-lactamase class C family)
MDRDKIPGLAACIIKDDKIVWSTGFGFQNIEHRIPMTTRSIMGIASISKIVTAIAVMQLAEHKQLDLNEPINKYLPFKIHHPDYPDAEITISQLLSHTSSISNGPSLWRSYSCESQTMNLREWVKAYFLPEGKFYHKEGNFARWKPGEGFSYSNAEYPLLAYLIEVVSGISFNQYCKRNIFDPLEMLNTSFNLSDELSRGMATMYSYGYSMDLERDLMQPNIDCRKIILGNYFFPLCNYTAPTIGAAGLYSSAEQLSHLLIALMQGGVFKGKVILSKASVAKTLSPYVNPQLLPGQFASFGLGGYAMRLNNGESVWGHTGADPGISSYMLFSRETRIGAIVLANRFVDIRDLIEWLFAEGIGQYWSSQFNQMSVTWKQYAKNQRQHKVIFRVLPNYLPGGSRINIIGDHRYLGSWVTSGIPMSPQKERTWEQTYFFPDSTRIEFKITRGSWHKEAVSLDGKVPPKYSLVVVKDTVFNIVVEDWKDLVGE